MQETIEQQVKNEPKKEPDLTRRQRREMERGNAAAQETYFKLCQIFHNFFMENDPNGIKVKEKQKELSAKWKMYCWNNRLKEEAMTAMDDYCDGVFKKYTETYGQ